jgi:Protein of unknown function (DUF3180)
VRLLRLRQLLGAAAVVALVTAAVLDRAQAAGARALPVALPPPALLTVLAVAVLVLGLQVRRSVRGRRRPLAALTAARVAAIAAASGWTGALLAGWYGGQALALARALVGERTQRFTITVLSAVAAVLLSAAGVVAQRCCRPPTERGGDTP